MSDKNNRHQRTQGIREAMNESMSLEIGKLPPQALDLEEAVLGAVMLEPERYLEVASILKAEHFYKDAHARMWSAVERLKKKNEPVDILTVTHDLRANGELELVGGPFYISECTNRVASAANIETHARIIVQKSLARELIQISGVNIREAYDDTTDIFDLISKSQRALEDLIASASTGSYFTPKGIIKEMVEDVHLRMTSDKPKGLISSIATIQNKLNGYHPSELIVVAGRPGSGKTALMLSEAYHWANAGYAVAISSMEMSKEQLLFRMASIITGISGVTLSKGKLTQDEWLHFNKCLGYIESLNIYIDDTPNQNIHDIRNNVRSLKQKHNIRIFCVDYLQLATTGDRQMREQEIATISRLLKVIAKENSIPVMALSQLSRDVEKRGGSGKPKLADLRESGAIEQDADVVGFTWRPHEYEPETYPSDLGYFVIAKNRNGSLGDCRMRWIKEKTYYTNYAAEITDRTESKKPELQQPTSDEVPF